MSANMKIKNSFSGALRCLHGLFVKRWARKREYLPLWQKNLSFWTVKLFILILGFCGARSLNFSESLYCCFVALVGEQLPKVFKSLIGWQRVQTQQFSQRRQPLKLTKKTVNVQRRNLFVNVKISKHRGDPEVKVQLHWRCTACPD